MREVHSEYASPGETGNVCLFVEINQLINVEHDTSLMDYSGHLCQGCVGFMTRFESFIHCQQKRRPTVDLSVCAQLAGPIIVLIPSLTLEVGSNNSDKVGVAIPGALVLVKIIVNGLIPSLVRGIGVDGTIVYVWLRNLELLLLLTPLDSTQLFHDQKAFLRPHPFLLAMSQEAFQGPIAGTPIGIVATGRRVRAFACGSSETITM